MIRRLLAVTGVAASLLGATFVTTPVADAAPGDPNQVALVVDYPNGSTRSFCVGYRSGMSGADVLAVAGFAYGTGPYAGFVLQIGGQGTVPPTDDDYWAYWITAGGRLVYSGAGVSSTRPAAGTVEAWHWNSSGGKESPSGGSYVALCPNGFATAPAPASPASSAPAAGITPPPAGGGGTGGGTTMAPTSGVPASPRDPGTTSSTGTGTAAPAASTSPTAPAPSGEPAGRSATAEPSVGPTSVAASDVAARTDGAGGLGAGATVGLLVAGFAVVAFAVLAVLARRRRLEQD